MQITIDTANLSEMDIAMLAFLAEQGGDGETVEEAEEPEEAPAPAKTKAATKKAAAKPAPEPDPEPEATEDEDLVGGDGPTMADAVARATTMVSEGQAAQVKAALAVVGAKRVSEIAESDLAKFFAALDAE